ncbi:hypothetical protein Tco_1537045 [Tanacetum coccineum]
MQALRSIYGLKEASRSWNKRFDEEIKRLDLNKSQGAQTPKEVNRMKNVPYASALGSIMYAVNFTGGNPSTELRVECYCDAGFETDRDDTKFEWRRSGLEELQAKYHCNVCYRI